MATHNIEDTTNSTMESSASEQAYARAVEKFHEDGGADMMRWASSLGPIPAAESTDDNKVCVLLVEKTLALAKVASRIVWGIRSSMEKYKDVETDFVKIHSELRAAFDTVIAAIAPSLSDDLQSISPSFPEDDEPYNCVIIPPSDKSGGNVSPKCSRPESPSSDIYALPSDGISPGQILSDHDYLPLYLPSSDIGMKPITEGLPEHRLPDSASVHPCEALPDSLTTSLHSAAHELGNYLVDRLDKALDQHFDNLKHQLESTLLGHSGRTRRDTGDRVPESPTPTQEDASPKSKRPRL